MATNATNNYSNSRYIVDNVTPGWPFATVQSAINAAVAAGGAASIWLRQGTYNENLTLYDNINIEGQEQTLSVINGTHTPPATGSCRFTRVGLRSATDIFSSAVAGSALLSCLRCQFTLTNGYVYNLPNWTGELRMRWCTDYSTKNGLVYNTGGSAVTINHSLVGVGSNVFTANGNVTLFSVRAGCPILLNGTGTSVFDGGSEFSGNISTANSHNLTLAQVRITTGAAQAITHNSSTTLIMNSVVVNTNNATAIGGTGSLQLMSVQFPNSNTLAGTLTTLLTGVNRTAEVWADNLTRQDNTGFYSWAAAGPYFDDTTLGTFKLLVGGTGYIKGKRVTWVAQDATGMTAGNTYYIYIDSTGTIGKTATRTDALFTDYIVLFECMRDSTPVTNNQLTVKENHNYAFPTGPSNYIHGVIGIVIENASNGANIALNGTQKIQINGADNLEDHGLTTTVPDSGGVGVTWRKYYTTAAGKWALYSATDTFTGHYNNGGSVAALGGSKFGVYRLYATKDSLNSAAPIYIAVLDITQYNNITAANTAIANGTPATASNELAALEIAQLGYIIFSQASSSIVQVTIAKSTVRQTISSGGTNTASLVNTVTTNFNSILSAADTNVQAALDTIDNYGVTPKATGDDGGLLTTTGLTNVVNTGLSTGVMTIHATTTNPGSNAGYIKMYVGTTAVYVPYWTTIAP